MKRNEIVGLLLLKNNGKKGWSENAGALCYKKKTVWIFQHLCHECVTKIEIRRDGFSNTSHHRKKNSLAEKSTLCRDCSYSYYVGNTVTHLCQNIQTVLRFYGDTFSRADRWINCVLNDTSKKFCTEVWDTLMKIFGYRDIADLTFSDR